MLNSGFRLDNLTRLMAVIDGYDGLVDAMADAPCAGVSDRMLVSPATLMRRYFPLPFVPIKCAPWSVQACSARVYVVKGAIYAINSMDMCVCELTRRVTQMSNQSKWQSKGKRRASVQKCPFCWG